jgi:hypothetical protein
VAYSLDIFLPCYKCNDRKYVAKTTYCDDSDRISDL